MTFLTNNFERSPETLAALTRQRWRIERFFNYIKQHLRIGTFDGTTPNAVKAQIWIAISVYVLVASLKKELQLKPSLYTILGVLGIGLFEKTPNVELLDDPQSTLDSIDDREQPKPFDF